MRKHFKAPWEAKLKILTVLFLSILVTVAVITASKFSVVLITAIILGCSIFIVRGYSIIDGKLLIHRLGWAKEFKLKNLRKLEVSPDAMVGSVRTWGIGGLFGYTGFFRNSVLGTYRAYATNGENTVVLEFENEKVVVTPGSPKEFAQAVEEETK